MNESFLLKVSLLVCILGLGFLFIVAKTIEINDTTIKKITHEDVSDETVIVTGKIIDYSITDTFTRITLQEQNWIEVLLFNSISSIEIGDTITVEGRIQEGDIIAEKISYS